MSRIFLWALAIVALVAGSLVYVINDKSPLEAPGLVYIEQRDFDLAELQNKVVYLDFWASWCIPCRQSFPWMQQMVEKYHDQGLRIITVNLDSDRDDAEAFIQEFGANFPVVLDPDFNTFGRYDGKVLPTSIVFNHDGTELTRHIGFDKSYGEKTEKLLVKMLEEKES